MPKRIYNTLVILLIALTVNAEHTLTLKTGEKMNGTVQSLKDGVINFEFKGNTMKFPVADVSSIQFGESATSKPATGETGKKEPGEKQISAGSYLVRYKVADRTIAKPPLVSNLTQEKGTVIVEVTVDKYGHVMKALPGAKGSTTTSEYLFTKAKQAAESAQFNKVPTAPLEQTGYMIIAF